MAPSTLAFAAPAPLPGLRRAAPSLSPHISTPSRRTARLAALRAVASREPTTAATNAVPTDTVDGMLSHTDALPDASLSAIQTMDDVEEIIALAAEFDLYDFRVEDHGVAVEISRAGGVGFEDGKLIRTTQPMAVSAPGEAGVAVDKLEAAVESDEGAVEELKSAAPEGEEKGVEGNLDPDAVYDSDFVVKSNRVGFFYSGAKSKPPLVNVGDHVNFNQPVCIIEQLGQQYVYLSEASGTVLKVFVEDGDVVEYDQQVMVIRPD